MKKIVLVALIALLMLIVVPHAFAANSCGNGVTWSYSNYVLTFSGTGNGVMYDYGTTEHPTAPWKSYTIRTIRINNGIKYIGKNAFKGMSALTFVRIESSTTELGAYAFSGCTALNNVVLTSGLKIIGERTFDGCTALTSITLPQGLETIGMHAFYNTGLTSIEFPSGLTKIESGAFSTTKLTAVTIPNTVTEIGSGCFEMNDCLTTASLPSGMTEIPDSMFSGCSKLNNVVIPSGVTRIGDYAFYYCQYLTNLTLPSGLQEIGKNAFRDIGKSLFLLPGTVTSIGRNAFDRANSPSYSVRVLIPDSVTSLPDHMLISNENSATFLVHASYPLKGSIDAGARIIEVDDSIPLNTITDFGRISTNLFYYISTAGKLVLSGTGDIPANQFKNKTSLTEVEIQGNNIKNIGASAFEGCTNLTKVRIPQTMTSIGNRAFYGCSKLADIRYEGSNENIIVTDTTGSYAFYGCSALQKVTVYADSGIGEYAFANCTGLQQVSSYVKEYPEGLFKGCTGLQKIYLHECTAIGPMAFDGCTSLSTVFSSHTYSNYQGYKTISENAFRGCMALNWYFLPVYVTSVAENAFPENTVLLKQNGCSADIGSHAAFSLPASVSESTHITAGGWCGTNAIYYISGYTNVAETTRKLNIAGTGAINANAFKGDVTFNRLTIGEGITEIGSNAFQNSYCCEAVLPASLQTIGAYAFDGCTNFDTLSWQNGLKTIQNYAFNNTKLSTIELPETVQTVGYSTFSSTSVTPTLIRIPASVNTLGTNAFGTTSNINSNTTVIYSESSCYNPSTYNGGTGNATKIPVKSGVSVYALKEYGKCGTSAYYYITNDNALYVTGTGAIQDYAFYNNTHSDRVSSLGKQLTSVTIGEGITHVGQWCFYDDDNIASVWLPNSLQSAGKEAFSSIYYLNSIHFPNHDFSAGDHLFYSAYKLENVTLPEGLKHIEGSMFSQCNNLKTVVIPSTVTEIGNMAFHATKLSAVTLPEGLETIGYDAFYGVAITEVILPASLESMSPIAFENCRSLNQIVFRGSIPSDTLLSSNVPAFPGVTADLYVPHGTAVWAAEDKAEGISIHYYCPEDEENMAAFMTVMSEPTEPTCTEEGYESYPYCEMCGAVFNDENATAPATQEKYAIPARGHSYESAPEIAFAEDGKTCTADFACQHGDYTLTVPMTVQSEVNTPAGCLTKGKTLYTATLVVDGELTVDGETVRLPAGTYSKTLVLEDIPAAGHTPEAVAGKAATCTEDGLTEGSVCAVCNEVLVEQVTIPATGHSYTSAPVFSFAEDGSSCTAAFTCEHEDNTVMIPVNVRSKVKTAAGCLTKGTTLYSATLTVEGETIVDGETVDLPEGTYSMTLELEDIPAKGHHPSSVAGKAATCTETGLTEGSVCAECSEVLVEQKVIPATGHSYTTAPVLTFAEDGSTCTAAFTCDHEDNILTLPADVESTVDTPAGCVTKGKTLYSATLVVEGEMTVEGETVRLPEGTYVETLVLEDIPGKGHTPVVIPGKEATCTKTGKKDYIFCEECAEVLQEAEAIPALGHKDSVFAEAVEATCTKDGHTAEHRCAVCGTVLTEMQTIPATGHHYGEPAFIWNEDGTSCEASFSCEKGDDTKTLEAEISSEVTTEPTCTEEGSIVYTATVSFGESEYSDSLAPRAIPADGHTPVEDPAVAPTDRETGKTKGSHCSVCGTVLEAQNTIPALWSYSEDGKTVTAYNGAETELIIPGGVNMLGASLFKNNTTIIRVQVPDEVTAVGNQTFYRASNMTDIYLPDDLSGITYQTFYNTNARLHTSAQGNTARQLSSIDRDFTDGAWTLRFEIDSQTDEATGTILAGWAGTDDTLVLPENFGGVALKEIRGKAFEGQEQLKRVTVPASVTAIADDAFDGCSEELTLVSAYNTYAREWALANGIPWAHDQHTPQVLAAVPATYTETGLTEGSICAECGEILQAQEIIPMLEPTESFAEPEIMIEICDDEYDSILISFPWVDGADYHEISIYKPDGTQVNNGLSSIWGPERSPANKCMFQVNIVQGGQNRLMAPGEYYAEIMLKGVGYLDTTFRRSFIVPGGDEYSFGRFVIPGGTTSIEEEAFAGIPAKMVKIPAGCGRIESKAFDGSSVKAVYIPSGDISIADDALPEGTLVYTPEGSAAAGWAKNKGYEVIVTRKVPK